MLKNDYDDMCSETEIHEDKLKDVMSVLLPFDTIVVYQKYLRC